MNDSPSYYHLFMNLSASTFSYRGYREATGQEQLCAMNRGILSHTVAKNFFDIGVQRQLLDMLSTALSQGNMHQRGSIPPILLKFSSYSNIYTVIKSSRVL